MAIWKKHLTLEQMNQFNADSAISHLGIKISAQGDDWLAATMPVDQRTTQPMGVLHGGISVALAESVGSLAGFCCVDEQYAVVGSEVNASHLRPVRNGTVTAKAQPIKLGKSLQVWQIEIHDERRRLCCLVRLTLSVIAL